MVHVYGHDCKRLQQVSLRGRQNNSMQCSWYTVLLASTKEQASSWDMTGACCAVAVTPAHARFGKRRFIILRTTTTTMTTIPLDCFSVTSMFLSLCELCSPDMPQSLCHFILPNDCMLTITVVTGFLSDCALTISILPMRQYKATSYKEWSLSSTRLTRTAALCESPLLLTSSPVGNYDDPSSHYPSTLQTASSGPANKL